MKKVTFDHTQDGVMESIIVDGVSIADLFQQTDPEVSNAYYDAIKNKLGKGEDWELEEMQKEIDILEKDTGSHLDIDRLRFVVGRRSWGYSTFIDKMTDMVSLQERATEAKLTRGPLSKLIEWEYLNRRNGGDSEVDEFIELGITMQLCVEATDARAKV